MNQRTGGPSVVVAHCPDPSAATEDVDVVTAADIHETGG
jgi:hypothetical protein